MNVKQFQFQQIEVTEYRYVHILSTIYSHIVRSFSALLLVFVFIYFVRFLTIFFFRATDFHNVYSTALSNWYHNLCVLLIHIQTLYITDKQIEKMKEEKKL